MGHNAMTSPHLDAALTLLGNRMISVLLTTPHLDAALTLLENRMSSVLLGSPEILGSAEIHG
jgi:hypothetical protein